MKKIVRPYKMPADKQPFSCFAETPKVDFAKGTNRDDVSFYKKLARFERSQRLGIPVDQYETLLRQHKAGKVVVKFNDDAAMHNRRLLQNTKKNGLKTMTVSNPSVTYLSENDVTSNNAM